MYWVRLQQEDPERYELEWKQEYEKISEEQPWCKDLGNGMYQFSAGRSTILTGIKGAELIQKALEEEVDKYIQRNEENSKSTRQ